MRIVFYFAKQTFPLLLITLSVGLTQPATTTPHPTQTPKSFTTTLYKSPINDTYTEILFVDQAYTQAEPQGTTISFSSDDYNQLATLAKTKNSSGRRKKMEQILPCKELLAALEFGSKALNNSVFTICVKLPESDQLTIVIKKYYTEVTTSHYMNGFFTHNTKHSVPSAQFTIYQNSKTLPNPIIETIKTIAVSTNLSFGQKVLRGFLYTGGVLGVLIVAAIIDDYRNDRLHF